MVDVAYTFHEKKLKKSLIQVGYLYNGLFYMKIATKKKIS